MARSWLEQPTAPKCGSPRWPDVHSGLVFLPRRLHQTKSDRVPRLPVTVMRAISSESAGLAIQIGAMIT